MEWSWLGYGWKRWAVAVEVTVAAVKGNNAKSPSTNHVSSCNENNSLGKRINEAFIRLLVLSHCILPISHIIRHWNMARSWWWPDFPTSYQLLIHRCFSIKKNYSSRNWNEEKVEKEDKSFINFKWFIGKVEAAGGCSNPTESGSRKQINFKSTRNWTIQFDLLFVSPSERHNFQSIFREYSTLWMKPAPTLLQLQVFESGRHPSKCL